MKYLIERYFARFAISTASLVVAMVIAIAAVVFLWGAVYFALAQTFSPAIAALLTGIGALIFCLLIVMTGNWPARLQTRPRSARIDDENTEASRAALEMGRMLGKELRGLTSSEAKSAAVASLIAGFALGDSPPLRRFLRDIISESESKDS
jgi:hypothetical protein